MPNLVEPMSLVLMFNNLGQTIIEYLLSCPVPTSLTGFLAENSFLSQFPPSWLHQPQNYLTSEWVFDWSAD